MPPVGGHLVLRVREHQAIAGQHRPVAHRHRSRAVHQHRSLGPGPEEPGGGGPDQMRLRHADLDLHPTGVRRLTPVQHRHRADPIATQREQHRRAPPVVHRRHHELLRQRERRLRAQPERPDLFVAVPLGGGPISGVDTQDVLLGQPHPEVPHPQRRVQRGRQTDLDRPGHPGRLMRVPRVGRVLPHHRQRRIAVEVGQHPHDVRHTLRIDRHRHG